ncbi:MAG: 1-acyl-sn-glycerol-3-phosphate acyltransferase [Planctomycetaceae bacterium]|nr:1-acyl-sn-glycerol-3-phosphate acyltransferase [Planctomycetaceae bacterium]
MAWKSFYLAAGVVGTVAFPFLRSIEGGANVPDGACLIAANHSSFLDGPLLAYAYCRTKLLPLHMVAYEEPFAHPIMGWILRSGKAIPFRRGDRRSQGRMLSEALGWLAADEAVGIFPEGHINHQPRLNRARPGLAILALKSGLPVGPTAIIGTHKIMPRGANFPRLAPRAQVVFGRPVGMLDKERLYRELPASERKILIKNYGYRVMRAIGALSGRGTAD